MKRILLIRMEEFRVVEVPVSTNPRFSGTSHYGVWNRLFTSFRDLLAVRWMKLRKIRYEISESVNIAYEHTRTHRYHVDRERIPVPRSGLELYHDSWLHRERFVLDAFFCPMACLRASGRKRHPDIVLVLEHRRQRDHVLVLYFQTGPDRYLGILAKLTDIHSQFNADPERPVCSYCCRTFPTPTRNGLDPLALANARVTLHHEMIRQPASLRLSNPWPCGSGRGRWDDRKR